MKYPSKTARHKEILYCQRQPENLSGFSNAGLFQIMNIHAGLRILDFKAEARLVVFCVDA